MRRVGMGCGEEEEDGVVEESRMEETRRNEVWRRERRWSGGGMRVEWLRRRGIRWSGEGKKVEWWRKEGRLAEERRRDETM